jgi:hypothetical protein
MRVALSRDRLLVQPHWFAKWLAVALCLDLSHEIPVASIERVEESGEWRRYGRVEIRFRAAEGGEGRLLLYLREHRQFVEAVRGIVGR